MPPIILILSVLVILAVAFWLNLYFAYKFAFGRNKKMEPALLRGFDGDQPPARARKRELIKELASLPYEDVFITSYDGLKLRARYYKGKPDSPVAIGFHGYRSNALRDLAGLTTYYYHKGYDVIIVDERAHGMSEGKATTFGAKERFDVLSWSRYAEERFGKDKKIILFGLSMGAASIILASALDLPDGVKLAVCDCPYSSASTIIKKVCSDKKCPPKLAFPTINLGAKTFGRFNLSDSEPIKAIKEAKIPIFLVHGTADKLVPYKMSDSLAEAGKTVTYLRIDGAPHLLAMMCDEEGYIKALEEHQNSILNP